MTNTLKELIKASIIILPIYALGAWALPKIIPKQSIVMPILEGKLISYNFDSEEINPVTHEYKPVLEVFINAIPKENSHFPTELDSTFTDSTLYRVRIIDGQPFSKDLTQMRKNGVEISGYYRDGNGPTYGGLNKIIINDKPVHNLKWAQINSK